MKTRTTLALLLLLALTTTARADEGMWLLHNLSRETRQTMRSLGLQLSPKDLYNPKKPSLKDGVVSFGGFCTGVVVSADGLVLTNHHCGFSHVQQLSSAEHDYVTNGFTAASREDELPCPGLYVRFLLQTVDVTNRVVLALDQATQAMALEDEATDTATSPRSHATADDLPETLRDQVIDSMATVLRDEVWACGDSTLIVLLDAYYGGTEFTLSTYRDFDDVRLVFAPPSSVGKFGWDTDNWEWPRHTGDFCVFRIYADPDGQPAGYDEANVPYHPPYVVPLSMEGYREGDACMTIGYPGTTDRYLSSYGVEERVGVTNQTVIDVRGVRQAIWKREMDRRPDIHLMYASKYDQSSNYWKNAIGMNRAVRRLHVVDRRRQAEELAADTALLGRLQQAYAARRADYRAFSLLVEALLESPEIITQTLSLLSIDLDGDTDEAAEQVIKVLKGYRDIDSDMDREVFTAMLNLYREQVDAAYLPDFYARIDTAYGGSCQAFVDALYQASDLDTDQGLRRAFGGDSTYNLFADPAMDVCFDLITKVIELQGRMDNETIARNERLLTAALRARQPQGRGYPDANSTMRLSLGTVGGYRARDGVDYAYYTTSAGVLQKARAHRGDPDFSVQPRLLQLLAEGDFGPYADRDGRMYVCFITDNDITGGNSGSPMFDARGRLLGLAFDGNWEAMSGDLLFEPQTQRCIGVDIRYVLFIIDRYAGNTHLVAELLNR